jgi:hypothetical protein
VSADDKTVQAVTGILVVRMPVGLIGQVPTPCDECRRHVWIYARELNGAVVICHDCAALAVLRGCAVLWVSPQHEVLARQLAWPALKPLLTEIEFPNPN